MQVFAVIVIFSFVTGSDLASNSAAVDGRVVIALDVGSARTLRDQFPHESAEPLIRSADEPYAIINARALEMRGARCLVYRSDRLTAKSRLFRDRLAAQGVITLDLTLQPSGIAIDEKKQAMTRTETGETAKFDSVVQHGL